VRRGASLRLPYKCVRAPTNTIGSMSADQAREDELLKQAAAITERRKRERDLGTEDETARKQRLTQIAALEASVAALAARLERERAELLALKRAASDSDAMRLGEADRSKLLNWLIAFRQQWATDNVADYMTQYGSREYENDSVSYIDVQVIPRSMELAWVRDLARLSFESVALHTHLEDCPYSKECPHFDANDNGRVRLTPPLPRDIVELLQRAGVTLVTEDTTYTYREGDKSFTRGDRREYGAGLLQPVRR